MRAWLLFLCFCQALTQFFSTVEIPSQVGRRGDPSIEWRVRVFVENDNTRYLRLPLTGIWGLAKEIRVRVTGWTPATLMLSTSNPPTACNYDAADFCSWLSESRISEVYYSPTEKVPFLHIGIWVRSSDVSDRVRREKDAQQYTIEITGALTETALFKMRDTYLSLAPGPCSAVNQGSKTTLRSLLSSSLTLLTPQFEASEFEKKVQSLYSSYKAHHSHIPTSPSQDDELRLELIKTAVLSDFRASDGILRLKYDQPTVVLGPSVINEVEIPAFTSSTSTSNSMNPSKEWKIDTDESNASSRRLSSIDESSVSSPFDEYSANEHHHATSDLTSEAVKAHLLSYLSSFTASESSETEASNNNNEDLLMDSLIEESMNSIEDSIANVDGVEHFDDDVTPTFEDGAVEPKETVEQPVESKEVYKDSETFQRKFLKWMNHNNPFGISPILDESSLLEQVLPHENSEPIKINTFNDAWQISIFNGADLSLSFVSLPLADPDLPILASNRVQLKIGKFFSSSSSTMISNFMKVIPKMMLHGDSALLVRPKKIDEEAQMQKWRRHGLCASSPNYISESVNGTSIPKFALVIFPKTIGVPSFGGSASTASASPTSPSSASSENGIGQSTPSSPSQSLSSPSAVNVVAEKSKITKRNLHIYLSSQQSGDSLWKIAFESGSREANRQFSSTMLLIVFVTLFGCISLCALLVIWIISCLRKIFNDHQICCYEEIEDSDIDSEDFDEEYQSFECNHEVNEKCEKCNLTTNVTQHITNGALMSNEKQKSSKLKQSSPSRTPPNEKTPLITINSNVTSPAYSRNDILKKSNKTELKQSIPSISETVFIENHKNEPTLHASLLKNKEYFENQKNDDLGVYLNQSGIMEAPSEPGWSRYDPEESEDERKRSKPARSPAPSPSHENFSQAAQIIQPRKK